MFNSAVFIKDATLNGKINQIELSPEHQAMRDKLTEAYRRLNASSVHNS